MLKQALLLFFSGLGIQRVVQDAFTWIDPELVVRKDTDYFSVLAIVALYTVVKYLKQKESLQPRNKTTN